jgi:hypothetical protein
MLERIRKDRWIIRKEWFGRGEDEDEENMKN